MEATPTPRRRLVAQRRTLLLAWAELLERGATGAPRPLRPLFEAELAFEAWAGALWRRARPVLAAGVQAALMLLAAYAASAVLRTAQRVDTVHAWVQRHGERRLAESWFATAMIVAILGAAAVEAVHPDAQRFVVDRLANGAPAPDEALVAAEAVEPVRTEAPIPVETAPEPPAGVAIPAPPPPPPAIPAQRGPLPVGKGMWIYSQAEGANVDAIVARATANNLTHVYVRSGTLREGFIAGPLLDALLPKAHAAGIRVYAWDFPYLNDVAGDINRAHDAIQHRTPDGHRIDGYVADIELRSMGVNVNPQTATAFGSTLRRMVGPNFPLIACVPRPSPALVTYPFAEVVASFDAIAPMVYWLGRDPAADVAGAIRDLKSYGKPIIPVGQAYDGVREGGPPGVPPRDQLLRFMQAAEEHGAVGVSWWSWQHADQQAWDAIRDAPQFMLPAAAPAALSAGQVRAYQALLTSLGFAMPATGAWDEPTSAAVRAYQTAARLPVTGVIDAATRAILFTPFGPPIQPQP
ncbi:MAG TPA: peptidoglycan-binding domain-containing protein [Acidimicrobiales bacterium]